MWICREASPTLMVNVPGSICEGMLNSYRPSSSGAATADCPSSWASARFGCQTVDSASRAVTVNGSPWGTTRCVGRSSSAAKVYRGAPPHGERSRAQALRAAAGNAMPSAIAATIGTAAVSAHDLCRGAGTASLKSRLLASLATSRTAASHSARDRACSKSLRTSSMMPRSWSPTAGCLRASSIASCSSRRLRQIHR